MYDKSSMEAIIFQMGKTFPDTLDNLFKTCQDAYPNLNEIVKNLELMSTFIKDRTGLMFEFVIENPSTYSSIIGSRYRISVSVPDYITFTPIDWRMVEKLETLDLNSFKQTDLVKGAIDPKTAKVSGCFSDINFKVHLSESFFDKSLEVADITNTMIHEMGHAYDYCYHFGSTLITTAFAAVAMGQIKEDLPVEKRIVIGNTLLKTYGVEQLVDERSADANTVVALLLGNPAKAIEKRTGRRYEAVRESELRADQFASRWGRGVSMAKTIIRLEASRGIAGMLKIDPKWVGATSTMKDVLIPLYYGWKTHRKAMMASGVLAARLGAGITVSIILIVDFIMRLSIEALSDWMMPQGRHPTTVERIRFLKADTQGLLKQQNLPDDIRRGALGDLEEYDRLLEEYSDKTSKVSLLQNYLVSKLNGRFNVRANERAEVELTNNSLHELVAVLKG